MHKSKTFAGAISCFLIISFIILNFHIEQTSAVEQDIFVDDDQRYPDEADGSLLNPYRDIQDAIDGAQNGDTIKVLNGNYHEHLIIDKAVTITAEDPVYTFISSLSEDSYLIEITADSVSLEGFTIYDNTSTSHRKATIRVSEGSNDTKIIDNIINGSSIAYGVDIEGAHNIVVRNNSIDDTRGINIRNSDFITIDDNIIGNCTNFAALNLVESNINQILENKFNDSRWSIYLTDSSENSIYNNSIANSDIAGIIMKRGSKNNIENNTIYNNGNSGIDFDSSDGLIFGNYIHHNGIGIRIDGSGYIIRNNSIEANGVNGIYARSGSSGNTIFNNSFTEKIGTLAADEGSNNWDDGSVGNYWDDFFGPDPRHSNSLDSYPQNLVTYNSQNVPEVYKYRRNGVVDNYPKGVYNTPPVISDPSPSNLQEGVSRSPRLSVIVTDPDPGAYAERSDVYFYYILENISYPIGQALNIESGGNASVWFSTKIEGKTSVYSYGGLGYHYIGVWQVLVQDRYTKNQSSQYTFTTMNTPVDNKKPIARITADSQYMVNGEIHAQINDTISFDASTSNDSDGEIIFYKWNFGEDETSIINEVSPKHTYSKKEGEFIVNLIVIDDNGSSNQSEIKVVIQSIANRAPTPVISAPSEGIQDNSIAFVGSGSTDPDNGDSIVSYFWNFDDGGISDQADPTHQFSAAGRYTVTLMVTDESGLSNTKTFEILIKSKTTEDSPGFEFVLAIISMLVISIILKKKK